MADKAPKAPKYISVSTVSVSTLMKASAGNANAGRTQKSTGETAWAQTVLYLHENGILSGLNASDSLDDLAESVRQGFKDAFMDDASAGLVEVPERGRNARTGKDMPLLDKDGQIKWSSWDQTRLAINYAKDIAKVAKAEILEEVILEKSKGYDVMSKNDALKRSGNGETPMQTIERSIKLISDKFPALKGTQMQEALDALNKLVGTCEDTKGDIESVTA